MTGVLTAMLLNGDTLLEIIRSAGTDTLRTNSALGTFIETFETARDLRCFLYGLVKNGFELKEIEKFVSN